MQEEVLDIYCCYCSCYTSKALSNHWLECVLKIKFNEVVNKYGREWKQTITQLQDYADPISHHTEFNNMFTNFLKLGEESVHDSEGDK